MEFQRKFIWCALLHILVVVHMIAEIKSSDVIHGPANARTFEVDYNTDQFLLDGKPFRYISGSFHYFRALPQRWRDKLRAMRAAGLNVVSTYVEWSLHNPKDGEYLWDGIADLENFIKIAEEEDLLVILRPGPYICAERDMGGIPHWLLHKYPSIQLRTADSNYLYEVRGWYNVLMEKMKPLLYANGGPIIMVQVENEYGSFSACDSVYLEWLRDETEHHVQGKALLFTTDGAGVKWLRCGQISNVFTTVDFGAGANITQSWALLRQVQPRGPLVNSEFYPGWLTHWQEDFQTASTPSILNMMHSLFRTNASFNFYMFFGGTNFGFTAGANDGGPGKYNADITSYDYDAPLDESGDPTDKYFAIRNVIGEYIPLPNIPVPIKQPKMNLGELRLKPVASILSPGMREKLSQSPIQTDVPISFEALNQYSGFVLYEANLPALTRDPSLLVVKKLRDRALVYVDNRFIGVLSRENAIDSLPLSLSYGTRLQILVENQGRINYNIANDFKGILGDVRLDNKLISNWTVTGFPLDNYTQIEQLIRSNMDMDNNQNENTNIANMLRSGPVIFYGSLNINEDEIYDTYLDCSGWGKGIAYINGFNIGRYWPLVGPQITLYVPKELLKTGTNSIVLLELQTAPESGSIQFIDYAKLGRK